MPDFKILWNLVRNLWYSDAGRQASHHLPPHVHLHRVCRYQGPQKKILCQIFYRSPPALFSKPCLLYVLIMMDDVFQYLYHFCLTEIVQNVTVNPAASQGSLFTEKPGWILKNVTVNPAALGTSLDQNLWQWGGGGASGVLKKKFVLGSK